MNAPQHAPRGAEPALPATAGGVMTVADLGIEAPARLLAGYGLVLERVADGAGIPGSYWGEPEAGIIGDRVYVRDDTPVHSLLHEACHLIVLPPSRRAAVHTDATDSVAEEDAVCVLQVLVAEALGVGRARAFADLDAWGYSFRLGSAQAYFEQDADEAFAWLEAHGLVDTERRLRPPQAAHRGADGPGPAAGAH